MDSVPLVVLKLGLHLLRLNDDIAYFSRVENFLL